MKVRYTDVVESLRGLKYPKEIPLGDEKLVFYYVNRSREMNGGAFVYRVRADYERPPRKDSVKGAISEGRTTVFKSSPNYTAELHRHLFDSGNKLF